MLKPTNTAWLAGEEEKHPDKVILLQKIESDGGCIEYRPLERCQYWLGLDRLYVLKRKPSGEKAKYVAMHEALAKAEPGYATELIASQAAHLPEALNDLGVGITKDEAPPAKAVETERGDDETLHKVTLTKGFWLGIHQVTQAQWQAVMGANPSKFKGDFLPVEQVSWDEAVTFCNALSKKDGKTYRLPTEAEWEYACRAGTTTPYHFGASISTDLANYNGNETYGGGPKGVYRKKTTPVGSFPPNAWGLHDMHGNVWEFCQDWYGGPHPPFELTDPQSGESGQERVLRGGSWVSHPRYCRSANRYCVKPDRRNNYVGCRVVLCLD